MLFIYLKVTSKKCARLPYYTLLALGTNERAGFTYFKTDEIINFDQLINLIMSSIVKSQHFL